MSDYNPYKKYCWAWWRFWLNLPGDIWDFICKMRAYAPLLWEDRDWDFNGTMRIMRFKLRRLRDHIDQHAFIAHREDVVAQLAKVDVMLRNVIDEDPDDEWSMHYHQWDAHIRSFKDCKNPKEHKRALKLTWEREQRNWFSLWRYISKNARNWWD